MPSLYVHLAPQDIVEAHIADDDPEHGRPSALAEYGVNHKVASFKDHPGTAEFDEYRVFETACGITQAELPNRMEEAEVEPSGNRCPDCFTEGN